MKYLLFLSLLVAACNDVHQPTRDRLAGTWLTEVDDGGRKTRLVMALDKGGSFRQTLKVIESDGSVRSEITEGDWFFDGETFKRRYLTVDGRRTSGIRFTSYEFVSVTDTELVCVDSLAGDRGKVAFRRVPDGTLP